MAGPKRTKRANMVRAIGRATRNRNRKAGNAASAVLQGVGYGLAGYAGWTAAVNPVAGGATAALGAVVYSMGAKGVRTTKRQHQRAKVKDFHNEQRQATMDKLRAAYDGAAKKKKAAVARAAVGSATAKLKSERKASAKKTSGNGTVKTHGRRTKSGKTATVKQHQRTPSRNPRRIK